MHRLRIAGVVGVSAALGVSAPAAMAAQQQPAASAASATSATSATLPVIVMLKSQLAAAPAGTAASTRRMAEASADQASLISAATGLGAKNIRQYQLVNSFAATVSPQALTGLADNPSVAEVIPDVTIHGDLGGTGSWRGRRRGRAARGPLGSRVRGPSRFRTDRDRCWRT
jgi:peptidase inhibitor I9